MSWKSLSCAALICVLASAPALAAPSFVVTNTGLNAASEWVWTIAVDPDETLFTNLPNDDPDQGVGGSVSVELGIDANAALIEALVDANFPFDTVGTSPFSFGGFPETGVTIGTGGDVDKLFAALGSDFFVDGDDDDPQLMLTIRLPSPNTANLTSTLETLGVYEQVEPGVVDDTGTSPIISQGGQEFATATVYSREAYPGDTNLSDFVNEVDLAAVLGNYLDTGTFWNKGNFNNQTDNVTNETDLALVLGNYLTGPGSGAGGVAIGGSSVPEPTSLVFGLGFLGVLLAAARNRR